MANNAILADEVHLSFYTRVHASVSTVGNLDNGRNFFDIRDTEDNTLLSLAFVTSREVEGEEFTRMEYNIGNGWMTASTNLLLNTDDNNLPIDDWNQVKVIMNEETFSIQLSPSRSGELSTILSDVAWTPGTGTQIGSLYITAVEQMSENAEATRIRYDDILVTTIPEPGSLALIALGVGGLLLWRRRS